MIMVFRSVKRHPDFDGKYVWLQNHCSTCGNLLLLLKVDDRSGETLVICPKCGVTTVLPGDMIESLR